MSTHDVPRGRLDPLAPAINDLLRVLRGRTPTLVPFHEVQQRLQLSHLVDRGILAVPLAAIVGSLNRSQDFDRAFLPLDERRREQVRQLRDRAELEGFAPVELYKVGGAYFVVDGHHRIAVARQVEAETIEAHVQEFQTEVEVVPVDTLASILARAAARNFTAATGLPTTGEDGLAVTDAAGHDRLLEHIAGHQYYLGTMYSRAYTWEEAVRSWQATVYRPVVQVIREHDLLDDFPGRTEADLYLWVSDRLHRLREQYGDDQLAPELAVPTLRWWRRWLRRLRRRRTRSGRGPGAQR